MLLADALRVVAVTGGIAFITSIAWAIFAQGRPPITWLAIITYYIIFGALIVHTLSRLGHRHLGFDTTLALVAADITGLAFVVLALHRGKLLRALPLVLRSRGG